MFIVWTARKVERSNDTSTKRQRVDRWYALMIHVRALFGLTGVASAGLLSGKMFARRDTANVWQIGEDWTYRNDGTIVILPIPNDTAVFGLTGKARARLLSGKMFARRANFLFLARSVSEGDHQPTRARNEREAEAYKGSRCQRCWGVNEPSWSPSLTLRARNASARPATLIWVVGRSRRRACIGRRPVPHPFVSG